MTKEDMVAKIAKDANMTKMPARRAMEALFDGVTRTLRKDGKISFVGFGTFMGGKRKARMGRNPQTGQPIKIAAARIPRFRPGKKLKMAIK
jgi:DNA-binding protein HU-beta